MEFEVLKEGGVEGHMSITRALVELKSIEERLNTLKSTKFITVAYYDRPVRASFAEEAKQAFQNITELLAYRSAMKSAIVVSNARTVVKVGSREYAVAEAIERKNGIALEKKMLAELSSQLQRATKEKDDFNAKVAAESERLVLALAGSDKRETSNYSQVQADYEARKKATLVDPLLLAERIAKLEADLTLFENNVNIALAESNSKTLIPVARLPR